MGENSDVRKKHQSAALPMWGTSDGTCSPGLCRDRELTGEFEFLGQRPTNLVTVGHTDTPSIVPLSYNLHKMHRIYLKYTTG